MLDFFKKPVEIKALETGVETDSIFGNRKDVDIFKAYIPNFLYKPPYGFPRNENLQQYKILARNPYIFSIIKTLCDEATSSKWEIKVKEEYQDTENDYKEKVKEVTKFFKNPNGNDESLQHILRQIVTDLLETDSGEIGRAHV